jgi:putative tributyrin esterase
MQPFFSNEISNTIFKLDGLRFLTVKSRALKRRVDITLYLPQNTSPKAVVILLHGVYGSHWAWALNGGVHITTQRLMDENKIEPFALVMPSDGMYGDGSAYLSHVSADYEKWIVTEVIQAIGEKIENITDAMPLFITGLSMGGYGALRLGAKYPDVFTSFSGLSSITDFDQMKLFLENKDDSDLVQNILKRESVLECILTNKNRLGKFRFDCGTDDLLIDFNRKLHKDLLDHQVDHIYEEFSGGHEWQYWQKHIEETLLFFNEMVTKNKE